MRHITEKGLQLIKRFESFQPNIYSCPAGYPTIGYGHMVKEAEKEAFTGGIDMPKALEILENDVGVAESAVLRLITVSLNDNQYGALVSFTFNLGAGALQRSSLRRKVNRQEHSEVPAEFLKWIWADGRKLEGLKRRRQAESLLYTST